MSELLLFFFGEKSSDLGIVACYKWWKTAGRKANQHILLELVRIQLLLMLFLFSGRTLLINTALVTVQPSAGCICSEFKNKIGAEYFCSLNDLSYPKPNQNMLLFKPSTPCIVQYIKNFGEHSKQNF